MACLRNDVNETGITERSKRKFGKFYCIPFFFVGYMFFMGLMGLCDRDTTLSLDESVSSLSGVW